MDIAEVIERKVKLEELIGREIDAFCIDTALDFSAISIDRKNILDARGKRILSRTSVAACVFVGAA